MKVVNSQEFRLLMMALVFGLLMCAGLKVLEKKSVVWASKYNERIK